VTYVRINTKRSNVRTYSQSSSEGGTEGCGLCRLRINVRQVKRRKGEERRGEDRRRREMK
jgi:hypothetical protein